MLDRKLFKKKLIKSSFWLSLVILLCFSIVTLSKYVTGVYAFDEARVAIYSISNNIDTIPINLGDLDNVNKSTSYDFIVSNKNENNKITEVKYKYKIKINTMKNIPLIMELYKNNDLSKNLLNNNLETDYIEMKLGDLQEDSFRLKISLDENADYLDSDLIDYLDIEIISEQVD